MTPPNPALILPSRPPRDEPTLKGYRHFDYETVEQPDARRARFRWDSERESDGWVFNCWVDAQSFVILDGDDQVGKFAQTLLDSTDRRNATRKRRESEPRAEFSDFAQFMLPVFKGVVAAPAWPDIVAVQPMAVQSDAPGAISKLELACYAPPAPPAIGDDEELHAYAYGGILAERGGWFVTHKGCPGRVLRYRQDWMS